MKKSLFVVAVVLFSSAAFADLKQDVDFLSEKFASNGSGSKIATYDVAKLDKTQAAISLYAERASKGCYNPKITVIETPYSSHAELNFVSKLVTKNYFQLLKNSPEDVTAEELLRHHKIIRGLLRDKTNKLVVTSRFSDDDDKVESCSVYRYDIYRADGTLVQLNFDHTD